MPEHSVHLSSHGAQELGVSAKKPMLHWQLPFFRSELAQHPQMVEGAIISKLDSQVRHTESDEQVAQVEGQSRHRLIEASYLPSAASQIQLVPLSV